MDGTEISGSEDLLHDVNVLINFASWAALLLVRLLTQLFKIYFIFFSKYILSPLSCQNTFYLFCSPSCSKCILSFFKIHFVLALSQIAYTLVLPSLKIHNTKFKMHFIFALLCFAILFGPTIITSMQQPKKGLEQQRDLSKHLNF